MKKNAAIKQIEVFKKILYVCFPPSDPLKKKTFYILHFCIFLCNIVHNTKNIKVLKHNEFTAKLPLSVYTIQLKKKFLGQQILKKNIKNKKYSAFSAPENLENIKLYNYIIIKPNVTKIRNNILK